MHYLLPTFKNFEAITTITNETIYDAIITVLTVILGIVKKLVTVLSILSDDTPTIKYKYF